MSGWRKLVPHPDFPMSGINAVEVVANRLTTTSLSLRFIVTGDLREVELPEPKHPSDYARRDELWRSTCFEAFVRSNGDDGYCECNLAPNGDWAAYRFSNYRAGMADAVATRPHFRADARRAVWYDLSATLSLDPSTDPTLSWSVGLAAIVETIDGTKSYWALAHPPGAPDFHHPACFAATLPPPAAP